MVNLAVLPNLDIIKNQVDTEFRAYVDAIEVLSALRDFLTSKSINCYIEKRVHKKSNNLPKEPDFIIQSGAYLFVDHKYTKSSDDKTLESKVQEIAEYNCSFIFEDQKTKLLIEINPECIMLTPKEVVKNFKKKTNCPITWGYKLDGGVYIEQSIGSVNNAQILSFFNPTLIIPLSAERRRYRFVLSHAPKPYTTWQIYSTIFIMYRTKDFDKSTFEVKYSEILADFNNLFPPWILKEAKQLNARRLEEALTFLKELGWLEIIDAPNSPEKTIVVDRKKFSKTGDALSYFKSEYAKQLFDEQMKQYKASIGKKGLGTSKQEQVKMSQFFNYP